VLVYWTFFPLFSCGLLLRLIPSPGLLAKSVSSVLTVYACLLLSCVSVLSGWFCFRFSSLPLLRSVFLSHSNEKDEGKKLPLFSCCWKGRMASAKVQLLLVPSLWLRKDMAAEEATAGRVAWLVPGCCWCWPWFSRGGAASCSSSWRCCGCSPSWCGCGMKEMMS